MIDFYIFILVLFTVISIMFLVNIRNKTFFKFMIYLGYFVIYMLFYNIYAFCFLFDIRWLWFEKLERDYYNSYLLYMEE